MCVWETNGSARQQLGVILSTLNIIQTAAVAVIVGLLWIQVRGKIKELVLVAGSILTSSMAFCVRRPPTAAAGTAAGEPAQ